MKIGAENKKQLTILAVVGGLALIYLIYTLVNMNSESGSASPASTAVNISTSASGTAKGHAAARVSNAQLDPTLHMEGMLLAESLEYTGSGRNIFSMSSVPSAPVKIERPVASARTSAASRPIGPIGPPPLPPIDLKFFGIAVHSDGLRQAFLLRGEDVYLASAGDIVSRRYKIVAIRNNGIEVTDLQNNNTQQLPLLAR